MSQVTGYICTLMWLDKSGRRKYQDYMAPTLAALLCRLHALNPHDCQLRGLWELRRGADGSEEMRAVDLDEAVVDGLREWLRGPRAMPR
ncbi:MAG: hypothetical protein ACE5H7_03665 [Acidiferrobacterales bacterium]